MPIMFKFSHSEKDWAQNNMNCENNKRVFGDLFCILYRHLVI